MNGEMENDKTQVEGKDINMESLLEAHAAEQGITKDELTQTIMSQMFTPQQRKIISLNEQEVSDEFALIQDKKSNLSRAERDLIVGMFARNNEKK